MKVNMIHVRSILLDKNHDIITEESDSHFTFSIIPNETKSFSYNGNVYIGKLDFVNIDTNGIITLDFIAV